MLDQESQMIRDCQTGKVTARTSTNTSLREQVAEHTITSTGVQLMEVTSINKLEAQSTGDAKVVCIHSQEVLVLGGTVGHTVHILKGDTEEQELHLLQTRVLHSHKQGDGMVVGIIIMVQGVAVQVPVHLALVGNVDIGEEVHFLQS